MRRLSPIMLAGTGSDVGKSMMATGLCRIFRQDGYHPAPFKAQNMALNSYATPDGLEIGRAQAVQAEAAGIPCHADMNPILLKPSGVNQSQVVLNGRPVGNRDAYEYFRKGGREGFSTLVHEAFDRLRARYNPIVMEGAGSIAEINLRDNDLVNMSMARYADAKVILVADIDRGGVFASAYGSIMLQTPDDRKRIRGIIVNKFRGDLRLFESGCKMLENVCGVPVLGVVPFATDIHIDEEDSVAIGLKRRNLAKEKVNVAVVLLKHISNFTDFNSLERHPNVNLFYTNNVEDIAGADVIIVPGSKATLSDLYELRRNGMACAIVEARMAGKTVIGICGGYQILGRELSDPDGIEGDIGSLPGLCLLPVRTILTRDKITRQIRFRFRSEPDECAGYEIHQGRTELIGDAQHVNMRLDDNLPEGCMVDDKCFGTYIHGILDNDAVLRFILKDYLADSHKVEFNYQEYKELQYNALADHLRHYIDIPRLYEIMMSND